LIKKLVFFLVFLPAAAFVVLTWDYYLSKFLFKRYCDAGLTGLFVYEQVELDGKYLKRIPEDADRLLLDRRFMLDEDWMIDRELFELEYELLFYKGRSLSTVGPIIAVETTVVRKTDGRLLGKAVSLANGLGWWINSSGFGSKVDTCPHGRDSLGAPNYYKDHDHLAGKVFRNEVGKGDAG
jgi:hypothetical protein